MASWLGIAGGCRKRIQRFATVQYDVQFMLGLRKTGYQVRASATFIMGKIERRWSEANAETIHLDCIPVFCNAILWYFCDASIHRADSASLQCAIGC